MNQPDRQTKRDNAKGRQGQAKWFAVAATAVVCVIGAGAWGFRHHQRAEGPNGLEDGQGAFAVRRGDLTISITESGDIKAVKSTDVKCEVEGRTAIVNIVPEGTSLTPEDVRNGKILVELDSSKLKESLAQRQIDLAAAEASQAEAKEAYEIQVKQNESNVTAADLKVRFALIDLQKYLGERLADRLIQSPSPNGAARPAIVSILADPNSLEGEAKQKLRELTGAITLATANLQNALYTLEWTEKLHQERYAAETELQRDRLNKQRLEIDREKAQIAQDLFLRYEFAKQVEKFLSDYQEAQRELERTAARARSQLAQAKAKLTSADATLALQKERLAKVEKQLVDPKRTRLCAVDLNINDSLAV